MSERALVSVIIPAWNGERYLGEALESVTTQTYRPIEIVVVDDGSTDGSAAVAKAFQDVRYVYQEHAGLAAALNTGIEAACGELISFLDCDDLWLDTKLEKQMALLEADANLEAVFTRLVQFRDDAPLVQTEPIEGYFKSTLIIRRAALVRVGAFNTQWRVGDFIDWYIRAQELGLQSKMLDEPLLRRRVHADNMSLRERDQRADYVHILKAALDRRKHASV